MRQTGLLSRTTPQRLKSLAASERQKLQLAMIDRLEFIAKVNYIFQGFRHSCEWTVEQQKRALWLIEAPLNQTPAAYVQYALRFAELKTLVRGAKTGDYAPSTSDLRELARQTGVKNYSRLNREDLKKATGYSDD